ncbi:hypothetical protein Tco_0603813 [Tanacetum coccineum]
MDEEEVNKLNDLNKDIIEEVTSKISCDAVMEKVADLGTVMEEVTDLYCSKNVLNLIDTSESPEIQVESHDFDLYYSKTVLYFFDTSESHEIFVESHEIQS